MISQDPIKIHDTYSTHACLTTSDPGYSVSAAQDSIASMEN